MLPASGMLSEIHLENNCFPQVTGELVEDNEIPDLPGVQELPRVSEVCGIKDPEVEEDLGETAEVEDKGAETETHEVAIEDVGAEAEQDAEYDKEAKCDHCN